METATTAMRRRALAVVLAALVVLPLFGAATERPAAAHDAAHRSTTLRVDGGVSNLWARRSGWGVTFGVGLADLARDDSCVHVDGKVRVENGPDRKMRLLRVCGAGRSAQRVARIPMHAQGTELTGVTVWLCRERRYRSDVCTATSFSIAQMARHATWDHIRTTNAVMQTSLAHFLRLKRSGWSNYDWTDDGCSAPSWVPSAATWSARFRAACLRHDFGYRNFGKRHLHPTDARRAWVDAVFRNDLQALCDHYRWSGCGVAATAFHQAVRNQGGRSFYGR